MTNPYRVLRDNASDALSKKCSQCRGYGHLGRGFFNKGEVCYVCDGIGFYKVSEDQMRSEKEGYNVDLEAGEVLQLKDINGIDNMLSPYLVIKPFNFEKELTAFKQLNLQKFTNGQPLTDVPRVNYLVYLELAGYISGLSKKTKTIRTNANLTN